MHLQGRAPAAAARVDERVHLLAVRAVGCVPVADGRPVVVLVLADADPSGWQMAVSISRKFQAFKIALFPDLEFQIRRSV